MRKHCSEQSRWSLTVEFLSITNLQAEHSFSHCTTRDRPGQTHQTTNLIENRNANLHKASQANRERSHRGACSLPCSSGTATPQFQGLYQFQSTKVLGWPSTPEVMVHSTSSSYPTAPTDPTKMQEIHHWAWYNPNLWQLVFSSLAPWTWKTLGFLDRPPLQTKGNMQLPDAACRLLHVEIEIQHIMQVVNLFPAVWRG